MAIIADKQVKRNPETMRFRSYLSGAGNVTRTHDLLITNQLLYRLSYTSICAFGECEYSTAKMNSQYEDPTAP